MDFNYIKQRKERTHEFLRGYKTDHFFSEFKKEHPRIDCSTAVDVIMSHMGNSYRIGDFLQGKPKASPNVRPIDIVDVQGLIALDEIFEQKKTEEDYVLFRGGHYGNLDDWHESGGINSFTTSTDQARRHGVPHCVFIPKGTGLIYAEKHNPFRCNDINDMGSEDEILLPPIKIRKLSIENMPKLVRSEPFARETESEIWHSNIFAEVKPSGVTLKELAKKAILKLEHDVNNFEDKWELNHMKGILGI